MKRIILITLSLMITLTLLTGCETKQNKETKTSLEPPVSDVSDGTSLPDTWTLINTTEELPELVIALNQDDTFTLLIRGTLPEAFSSKDGALLYGEYLNTKDTLTLGISNKIHSAEIYVDPITFNYTLDGQSLILSYKGMDYHFKRGELRHNF